MRIKLADRESDLMAILWQHGACTVAEVRDRLKDDLAYTTVLTILRTLEAKGYVGHEQAGRAHRYKALVAREAARRSALRNVSDRFFKGSTELLLTHLVEDHPLTSVQVQRIRQLLDKHERKTKA